MTAMPCAMDRTVALLTEHGDFLIRDGQALETDHLGWMHCKCAIARELRSIDMHHRLCSIAAARYRSGHPKSRHLWLQHPVHGLEGLIERYPEYKKYLAEVPA